MANAKTQEIVDLISTIHDQDVEVTSFVDALEGRMSSICVKSKTDPTVRGFAESYDEQEALQKAYSEFAERLVLKDAGHLFGLATSNGMAAHLSYEMASVAAANELVERDFFRFCRKLIFFALR